MTKASSFPPYLKEYAYFGIHAVQPCEHNTIEVNYNSIAYNHMNSHDRIKPIKDNLYHLPATHDIIFTLHDWLSNRSTPYQRKDKNGDIEIRGIDFANPDQDVALALFTHRSVLDRSPGSTFFFHNHHFYHTLTWTDILGPKHGKDSRLCRQRNNRLVIFATQRTKEETQFLIELFQKEQPPLKQ